MNKLSVMTCKNNHTLSSRAITLLTMSLILASTFIVTSSQFVQAASAAKMSDYTEVDPTL